MQAYEVSNSKKTNPKFQKKKEKRCKHLGIKPFEIKSGILGTNNVYEVQFNTCKTLFDCYFEMYQKADVGVFHQHLFICWKAILIRPVFRPLFGWAF
jgi:hypothetical protein